ncbi:Xaa-Pro peptidase family protein [soil metagenome]
MNARVQRLADKLREEGVDALLAHAPLTMGYLAGFWEDAHERFLALVVTKDAKVRLIAPALSEAQARRIGITDIVPFGDDGDPLALLKATCEEWGLKTLAVDDFTPTMHLLAMQKALPTTTFQRGGTLVVPLLREKGEDELALMRKTAKVADEAYREVLPLIREGMTEREVAGMLSAAMESRGGKTTFTIVAAGEAGAEPHHLSDDRPLKRGDVVILDFGCGVEEYQSDVTRTVAIGEASEEAREVYRAVRRAHMASRAIAKAGVTCGEVDAAARQSLEKDGLAKWFIHRVGHGIGLEGQREPSVAPGSLLPLLNNECFSVEPGVYLPGKFGIRIETIVTVTPDGCESLNEDPTEEITVV